MARPTSVAELLSTQFYDWEALGRGQMMAARPVTLEPPFREFEGHTLPRSHFVDDGQRPDTLTRLVQSVAGFLSKREAIPPVLQNTPQCAPEFTPAEAREELFELQVALPADYKPLAEVFEQCLFSLRYCHSALSFEIIGDKTELVAQLTAERKDAEQVFAQLKAHFPHAVITPMRQLLRSKWLNARSDRHEICEFGLVNEFMLPLQLASHLATDPLVAVCGAFDYLGDDEVGVFQVLFEPVRHRWAKSILRAVTTEDGDDFFENAPEILSGTKKKLARPLYGVVVRAAAKSPDEERVWQIIKSIAGALSLFENPTGNRLEALTNDAYPEPEHEEDLLTRSTRRTGMILNSDELISLAHLPSAAVRSRKLRRETKRTKAAPQITLNRGLILGENVHEGQKQTVSLTPDQRMRHVHVIGASGTGKSTLLLNMICQDMYQGRGVGVLDPHGDLVDQLLGYVPPERCRDVVLFDASENEYPIGFNILSAHSELEKTLLASDLVAVFQRLSTSWGDQMTSVLGNAILAFLESSTGGTLANLRRFLIEPGYREEFLKTVKDADVVYYWQRQFPLLKTNALGPLLTRLDTFLRPKTIRYMVAQQENKLDFGAMMNGSKILLAKLPQGIIGEENAFLLGTLLVSKFYQLTISRQEMDAAARRPYFLYLDEFHNFVTPTMAAILSAVRKYQLSLVLAHHEIAQLHRSAEVASAVLAQPYTRLCFRVGSDDARKLSDGFSHFKAEDLQNLGTGEAICRVERGDFDFNLRTFEPPKLDAAATQRRAYIRYLTRLQYGTPWQKVEEELAKSRYKPKEEEPDPFSKRAARNKSKSDTDPKWAGDSPTEPVPDKPKTVEPPAAPQPRPESSAPCLAVRDSEKPSEESRSLQLKTGLARVGRGGEAHQDKQQTIKELAAELGYIIDVEKEIPGGSVDVSLVRGKARIACEISMTTSARHELCNLRKRFEAGYTQAIMIVTNGDHAKKFKEAAGNLLTEADKERVVICEIADMRGILVEIAARTPISESVAHGRRIRVKHNPSATTGERDAKKAMLDTVAKLIQQKRKK